MRDPERRPAHYERVRWRQLLPLCSKNGLDLRRIGTFARRMGDADAVIAPTRVAFAQALVHVGPTAMRKFPRGRADGAAANRRVRSFGAARCGWSAVIAGPMGWAPSDHRATGWLRAMAGGDAAWLRVASDGIAITLSREGREAYSRR